MDYVAIGWQLTATGMMVVFSGLVLLFVLMSLFQWVEQKRHNDHSGKTHTSPHAAEKTSTSNDGISPELMVVIAAAITEATGKRVRVRRIRYRTGEHGDSWSRQGRVTVMGSHSTKR